MNIQTIRELIVVVSAGSLAKAAKQLYVSQSALSTRLKTMEHEIGFPLFSRNAGSALKMTIEGEKFLETAQTIVNLYDSAINECRLMTRQEDPIRIAANYFTTDLIDAVSGITGFDVIATEVDGRQLLFDAIEEGLAEITLAPDYRQSESLVSKGAELGMVYKPIGKMHLSITVMKTSKLASLNKLTLDDIKNRSLLITHPKHMTIWVDAVNSALGEQVQLKGSLKPRLISTAELLRQGFGEDLYITFPGDSFAGISKNENFVTFYELDGKPITMTLLAVYRESSWDWRYDQCLSALEGIVLQ